MSAASQNLDLTKFQIIEKIGEGGFGKVFLIEEINTGIKFAAKISNTRIETNYKDDILDLSREVNYGSSFNHPCLLKMIGYSPIDFELSPYPVIITEFLKNGSLSNLINLEHRLQTVEGWNPTKKLIMIYGIASGMKYLHSHNILHRDLKPQNILLDDYLFPKICDFGLSKKIHSNQDSMTTQSKADFKGTTPYAAPEIFKSYNYTKLSDVYAFGLVVYEIMTTEPLYQGMNNFDIFTEVVIRKNRPLFEFPIEKSYQKLIENCWSEDPKDRPTFDEIVENLEKNPEFLTDSIEKDQFFEYIEYIKNYPVTFNQQQIISVEKSSDIFNSKIFEKVDISEYVKDESFITSLFKSLFKISEERLFPAKEYNELSEKCKKLVVKAENNPENQFFIGTYLIEGKYYFPINIDIGVKYLERSISKGNIKSIIYLS